MTSFFGFELGLALTLTEGARGREIEGSAIRLRRAIAAARSSREAGFGFGFNCAGVIVSSNFARASAPLTSPSRPRPRFVAIVPLSIDCYDGEAHEVALEGKPIARRGQLVAALFQPGQQLIELALFRWDEFQLAGIAAHLP